MKETGAEDVGHIELRCCVALSACRLSILCPWCRWLLARVSVSESTADTYINSKRDFLQQWFSTFFHSLVPDYIKNLHDTVQWLSTFQIQLVLVVISATVPEVIGHEHFIERFHIGTERWLCVGTVGELKFVLIRGLIFYTAPWPPSWEPPFYTKAAWGWRCEVLLPSLVGFHLQQATYWALLCRRAFCKSRATSASRLPATTLTNTQVNQVVFTELPMWGGF